MSIARLRSLAAHKGLSVERHPWPNRVRIVCRNDAQLRHYPDGYSHGLPAFGYRHALRFLLGLPDAE